MARKKGSKTKVKEESFEVETINEETVEEVTNSDITEVLKEVQEEVEPEKELPEVEEPKEEVEEKEVVIEKEPINKGDDVVIEASSIKSYIGVRGVVERFTKGSAVVKTNRGNVTLPCDCLKKG